ncbi:MAG: Rrf2 family transcriptional regulator [Acidobacteriota bacterium]
MKLTTRTEYALVALLELAHQPQGHYASAESIAHPRRIPLRFLEQIFLALRRAGLVHSQKGQRGGYRLARDAEKISLAEVIRVLNGALAPTDCVSRYFYHSTPIEREPALVQVFREIRDHIARALEGTSLADVRDRAARTPDQDAAASGGGETGTNPRERDEAFTRSPVPE